MKNLIHWLPAVFGLTVIFSLAIMPANLNPVLLEVAAEYPSDGSYGQLPRSEWDTSLGLSADLYYAGKLKYRGDPQKRSYCSGLMFEIYLEACKRSAGDDEVILKSVPEGYFHHFRKDFYGVDGNEQTLVRAISDRGLGKRIRRLSNAKPGDLVQFWRNNGTGHAVLFLDCAFRDRLPSEITYWSVQFGGVRIMKEKIGNGEQDIDLSRIFIVRAYNA